MAHEATHVLQYWQRAFSTITTDPKKGERESFKSELQAYHIGAQVVLGLTESGVDLDTMGSLEKTHILVEQERLQTNANRQDPFDPNGALINRLKEIGLDITEI